MWRQTNVCFKSKSDGYRKYNYEGFVLDSLSKLYYVCDKNSDKN